MKKTPATETPLERYPKLTKAVDVSDLFLKREDLHSYGSHKGRSIPVMIDRYVESGDRHFAISSSGNAGLAAVLRVSELNLAAEQTIAKSESAAEPITLDVFVGLHVAAHKLEKLRAAAGDSKHIRILVKERPLQALTQAIQDGVRSLRQSTDDTALIGYASLARELIDTLPEGGSIFFATSSGTTAQAVAAHVVERADNSAAPIQIHIVQTSSCHPISDAFESYDGPDEISIADAIVDKIAQRKHALAALIEQTDGRGWIATNDDIIAAQKLSTEYAGLDLSTNGALAIAGAMKAAEIDWDTGGPTICVIGGE